MSGKYDVVIDADAFDEVSKALVESASANSVVVLRTKHSPIKLEINLSDAQRSTKSVRTLEVPELLALGSGALYAYLAGYLKASTDYGVSGMLGNIMTSGISSIATTFFGGFMSKPQEVVIYSDRENLEEDVGVFLRGQYRKVTVIPSSKISTKIRSPETVEDLRQEIIFKFDLLRQSHPDCYIEDIDDDDDLETLEAVYSTALRRLQSR